LGFEIHRLEQRMISRTRSPSRSTLGVSLGCWKRQGQAAKQPDPPSWECNADITKIKAQEGKGEPDASLCDLDAVLEPRQFGDPEAAARKLMESPIPSRARAGRPHPYRVDQLAISAGRMGSNARRRL